MKACLGIAVALRCDLYLLLIVSIHFQVNDPSDARVFDRKKYDSLLILSIEFRFSFRKEALEIGFGYML